MSLKKVPGNVFPYPYPDITTLKSWEYISQLLCIGIIVLKSLESRGEHIKSDTLKTLANILHGKFESSLFEIGNETKIPACITNIHHCPKGHRQGMQEGNN